MERPDDPDLTKETLKWDTNNVWTLADKLAVALGTLTADKQALDVTATWNAAGVTFNLLKVNVTDTASAAASLLMDLQVGGVSKFKVDKTGAITLGAALPVGSGGTGVTSGTSGGILGFTATGTLASSALLAVNGVVLGGGAGATPTATAAGVADQVFRVPGAGGAPAFGALDISKAAAVTGVLLAAGFPALTGDITTVAGALATTLKNTGPGATGPIGSATVAPVITIDAQGRVTALTSATIAAPAVVVGAGNFTRDISLASGTQTIAHGMSVTPKAFIFHANIGATARASWGHSIITVDGAVGDDHGATANTYTNEAAAIFLRVSGSDVAQGEVSSADGTNFVITWTKTGVPTGTASIHWMAIG